jgi:hypothetical protein
VSVTTPTEIGKTSAGATRWILVAGTGLERGMPEPDVLAAEAVGRALARHRYGLIAGVWHGVDWLVTQAFVQALREAGLDPKQYLIQVLQEGQDPRDRPGELLTTPYGAREWHDPQKYADAVILVGGRGGTYKTWLGALHDGIPRFPLGGLTGDSDAAFRQTCDLWDAIPTAGITLDEFSKVGMPIRTREDADAVAEHVVGELLWRAFSAIDAAWRKRDRGGSSLFISYSRKDSAWVERLRTIMRPAERRGLVSTWVDVDVEPGQAWEPQLLDRIVRADAVLLLVSPNLLQSKYIKDIELPAFMRRVSEPGFRLFWILLDACEWQTLPGLADIQAIGGTIPLSRSETSADAQCRLIEIGNEIVRTLEQRKAR